MSNSCSSGTLWDDGLFHKTQIFYSGYRVYQFQAEDEITHLYWSTSGGGRWIVETMETAELVAYFQDPSHNLPITNGWIVNQHISSSRLDAVSGCSPSKQQSVFEGWFRLFSDFSTGWDG